MNSIFFVVLALAAFNAFARQPLLTTPVMEYQCLENYVPVTHYFEPRIPPAPVSFEQYPILICHDDARYGARDSELWPRLNQREATFKLWDKFNHLFYDYSGDGIPDVSNWIYDSARRMGVQIPANTTWFYPFTLAHHVAPAGYVMPFWVNSTTLRSFCLTNLEYNSSNQLHRIFKDVIGVETEGLYVGRRGDGNHELVYINERELKKTWFYIRNGVQTPVTDAVAANVTIYFVYQNSVFKLMSMADLNIRNPWSNFPSHDRKFGCVPK